MKLSAPALPLMRRYSTPLPVSELVIVVPTSSLMIRFEPETETLNAFAEASPTISIRSLVAGCRR